MCGASSAGDGDPNRATRCQLQSNPARRGKRIRKKQIGTACHLSRAPEPAYTFRQGRARQAMNPTSILIPSSMQDAAILTIVLAFAGYLITFLTSRVSDRKSTRLNS